MIIRGDSLPPVENFNFSLLAPLDESELKEVLKDCYINYREVEFDLPIWDGSDSNTVSTSNTSATYSPVKVSQVTTQSSSNKFDSIEDLSLSQPMIPQFDVNKIWKEVIIDGEPFTIYTTLPEIPKRQCEISITTDINKMTDKELLNLFPQTFHKVRDPLLYNQIQGFKFDLDLGLIPRIEGFTEKQIIQNIIKFPICTGMYRVRMNGNKNVFTSFYKYIEIENNLYKTEEVWDSLKTGLPKEKPYMEEYVLRRYLLEEAQGKKHIYRLFDDLNEYITLFAPLTWYSNKVSEDPLKLAKTCINSRILYKRSRNPMLRRMIDNE
jgi:hypothetical protein